MIPPAREAVSEVILPLCKGEFPPEADPPLAEEGVEPSLNMIYPPLQREGTTS
jgi:hypothetical protein